MNARTPRQALRTLVPLSVITILLTLYLVFHISTHSAALDTTEWVLEISLSSLCLIPCA